MKLMWTDDVKGYLEMQYTRGQSQEITSLFWEKLKSKGKFHALIIIAACDECERLRKQASFGTGVVPGEGDKGRVASRTCEKPTARQLAAQPGHLWLTWRCQTCLPTFVRLPMSWRLLMFQQS